MTHQLQSAGRDAPGREETERLSLSEAARYLLEECRMVLPGIQALFGFQLIVVFNPGFDQKLTATEKDLHLVAITLVAIAVAIIMSPAAYQRQTAQMEVTDDFIQISTRLLIWSMFPLAIAVFIDLYLIGHVIIGASLPAAVLATAVLAVYVTLWLLLPRVARLQQLMLRSSQRH